MKIRESCLQNGILIYKAGISLTKQDFKLQNGSFGIQTGLSDCNLPKSIISLFFLLKINSNLLKNNKNILTNNITAPYNTLRYQILLI